MMESYQAKTLVMINQVQNIQEEGAKSRKWLSFCKKHKLMQMGLKQLLNLVLCF